MHLRSCVCIYILFDNHIIETLLSGLQNGEDNFSNFISAPTTNAPSQESQKKESNELSKSEEESFFNQVAPTEKEKVKLDKDSILALYGNTPAVNFNQFAQVPPYPQSTYQGFGGFPQQQTPVVQAQNGITQLQGTTQWSQQQWTNQGQFPAQTQVQYVPNPQQFQTNQFNQYQGVSQATVPGQMFQQPYQPVGNFPQPNPFFATQNVQQQFSNMNLGNPTANAGNVWQ